MSLQPSHLSVEPSFAISSEDELIKCFRPSDQKKLILPHSLRFPLQATSYLTWTESSGVYTYLLFKAPNWDLPRGVVFKRTSPSGEAVGGLCSWCNSYGSSDEIGLLSVAMNANVSYSYLICQNISCLEKIEDNAARAGKDPQKQISELYYRMGKLFENISSHKPD